jgi:hypothetical protein
MKNWDVIEDCDMIRHVVPERDLMVHIYSPACWCGPEFADGMYIHKAADCRELDDDAD